MVVSAIGNRMVVSHYWIRNGCNKVTIGYRMVVSHYWVQTGCKCYWKQNGCKSLLDTEWL